MFWSVKRRKTVATDCCFTMSQQRHPCNQHCSYRCGNGWRPSHGWRRSLHDISLNTSGSRYTQAKQVWRMSTFSANTVRHEHRVIRSTYVPHLARLATGGQGVLPSLLRQGILPCTVENFNSSWRELPVTPGCGLHGCTPDRLM